LADSGQAGEILAGIGRVRSLAFLSITRNALLLSQTRKEVKYKRTHRARPPPARSLSQSSR